MSIEKAGRISQRPGMDIQKRNKSNSIRRPRHSGKRAVAIRTLGLSAVKFRDKPIYRIEQYRDSEDKAVNFLDMYTELYACYTRYCQLLKLKPTLRKVSSDYSKGIHGVYQAVQNMVHKEYARTQINIEHTDEDGWHFTAFSSYNFQDDIYVYPLEVIKFLEKSSSSIVKHFLLFSRYFVTKLGFEDWNDNGHLGYIPEMLMQYADESAEDDPAKAMEMINDAARFDMGGDAGHYLDKLYNAKGLLNKQFITSLKRLKLTAKHETVLRDWMIDGISLLKDKEACHLQSFQWRVDWDEPSTDVSVYDEPAIGMDRMFIISWSALDHVFNKYLETINIDNSEFGSYELMEWYHITRSSRKPFKHSNWLNRVKEWMHTGLSCMIAHCIEQRKIESNNERFDEASDG